MGISISSKGSSVSLDMSYSAFYRLRTTVAQNLNESFGKQYSTLTSAKNSAEWDAQINKIIEDEHLADKKWQESLLDFFFMSDAEGSISYGTAKKIFDLVQNESDEDIYGYAGWDHPSTMGDFKQLLKDAYDNKKTVRWS